MTCHIRATGEETIWAQRSTPWQPEACLTPPCLGEFTFIVFFSSRFMWLCYGLSRQNDVLGRFLGRSRSHRVMENYVFETQKNTFMKHPTCAHLRPDSHTGRRRAPAKKMKIYVSCDNFITFCGPQAASPANPPRDAVPGT